MQEASVVPQDFVLFKVKFETRLLAFQDKIQTHKRFERMLFIRTKHNT